MRPWVFHVCFGVAVTGTVVGCTLLVPFDEIPDHASGDDDDGVDSGHKSSSSSSSSGSSGSSGTSSTSSSSSSSSSGVVMKPDAGTDPCDTTVDLMKFDCGGHTRAECGFEPGVVGAGNDDLVECDGAGNPVCVRHCARGCAQMPVGFADQCDDCATRAADGFYCGRLFPNASAGNADLAVKCVAGQISNSTATAKCGANKCADACPAGSTNGARPSCCLP